MAEKSLNDIYSKKHTKNGMSRDNSSLMKKDRLGLLSKDVAKELNTYRNWASFQMLVQPVDIYDANSKKIKAYKSYIAPGRKSLFQSSMAVDESNMVREYMNAPLLDDDPRVDHEKLMDQNDCSIRALVKASESGQMGRAIYTYADFMYCKNLGKISNNYLITLRRFPTPCGDYINTILPEKEKLTQAHMPDIGRMVTWLGTEGNEMGNILKYKVKMPFKEQEAKLEDVEDENTGSGIMGSIMNFTDNGTRDLIARGITGDQQFEFLSTVSGALPGPLGTAARAITGQMANSPYSNATWLSQYDQNKVYGPIDVIKKTTVRSDEGLSFEQSIQLQFDYELRSYDGINGKAAMLDLIANILAVCYTNGKFWGGGYRFKGAHQNNLFANLPIYKVGAPGGHPSTFTGFMNAAFDSMKAVGSSVAGAAKKAGGGSVTAGGILDMIKNGLNNLGGLFCSGLLNKLGRPQKLALTSIISPAPTGLWHLTIGNPRNPIMSIGNLIIDDCEIEHYGPLGLDDFPTGLRVKVTLKHGKPRDNVGIEMMYMAGDYRIYTPMAGKVFDMYKNCPEIKQEPINPSKQKTKEVADQKSEDNELSAQDMENVFETYAKDIGNEIKARTETTKIFNKFFGTSDFRPIMLAAQEAAYGSNPNKSKSK